jgi:hypothetical protein
MSGPKKADVQLKLERAVKSIQQQVDETERNAERFQGMGVSEAHAAREEAQRILDSCRATGSPELEQFAGAELNGLREAAGEIAEDVAAGEQLLSEAESLRAEAGQLHERAQSMLAQAAQDCADIMARIQGRMHYLHAEDREAAAARRLAEESLRIERDAGKKLKKASDATKRARNRLDKAVQTGRQYQMELNRVQDLASSRRDAARIAEENLRQATNHRSEADSLRKSLPQLNHEKFAPGSLNRLLPRLTEIETAFAARNYEVVNRIAPAILAEGHDLVRDVARKQSEWEAARKGAQNDLAAAGEELASVDRGVVEEWSGERQRVLSAFSQMDEARSAFDEERFADSQRLVAESLESLRALSETATTNRAKFRQREEIAEAIMNALYEQRYDNPEWYYADKDAEGRENQLSNLVIFAKAPGSKGDMRMSVDLDGHVGLEVQNIPEGEETLCHSLITNLQSGLAGEVDFQMTDWGRAANLRDARIQVPTGQQKTQEKVRERHGG